MKQTLPLGIVGILFITLALNGCSTSTPIVSEWRNPEQTSGSFQRLMIGGPSGDVSVRRNFEDELVAQLAAMGADALPSYRYMPENEVTNENNLKQAAQKARVDGLLLMRSVSVEEKTNYPAIGPEISFGIFGSNAGAAWSGIPGTSGPYRYNEIHLGDCALRCRQERIGVDRHRQNERADKRASGDQVLCTNDHESARRAKSVSEKIIGNAAYRRGGLRRIAWHVWSDSLRVVLRTVELSRTAEPT